MSDTTQFLDEMMPRIHQAEMALHNGDVGPRFEMWSRTNRIHGIEDLLGHSVLGRSSELAAAVRLHRVLNS